MFATIAAAGFSGWSDHASAHFWATPETAHLATPLILAGCSVAALVAAASIIRRVVT